MRLSVLYSLAILSLVLATSPLAAALDIKEGDFKTADGIKIHYYEAGQGTPVVLVHGFTSSASNNWIGPGVFEALAKNHRVIALDCRNHGNSDKPQPGTPGRSKDARSSRSVPGRARSPARCWRGAPGAWWRSSATPALRRR